MTPTAKPIIDPKLLALDPRANGGPIKPAERVSEFAKLLAEQAKDDARPSELFEVGGYFGLAGNAVAVIRVRVPLKWEQDAAVDDAVAYTEEVVKHPGARARDEVIRDAMHACVSWYACRDANDIKYPAFPSPRWMCKNMTSDQLGVLINLVNGVRAKYAPQKLPDDETIESAANLCAEHGGSDIPERFLAGWPYDVLVQAFVLLAMRMKRHEKDAAWLRGVLEKVREAAPEAVANAFAAPANATPVPEPEPEVH